MKVKRKDTVIFLGDSVTDCGRDRNDELSMGGGYANTVSALFRLQHPEMLVRFINKGIGGDQTVHILKRLHPDVLDLQPNIVTLCIGINDVLRSFYCPCTRSGLSAEQYRANMEEIIRQILQADIQLLLMPPFMIDTNPIEPMRLQMLEFGAICKELAQKYHLELLDLQTLFENLIQSGIYSYELSTDRIHPGYMGHLAIAMELLKHLATE